MTNEQNSGPEYPHIPMKIVASSARFLLVEIVLYYCGSLVVKSAFEFIALKYAVFFAMMTPFWSYLYSVFKLSESLSKVWLVRFSALIWVVATGTICDVIYCHADNSLLGWMIASVVSSTLIFIRNVKRFNR